MAAPGRRRGLRVGALLAAPIGWLGVVYLGSLAVLLVASFWTLDDFSGLVVRGFSLDNFQTILQEPVYRTIVLRTVAIAALVTLTDILLALPIAFTMVFLVGRRTRAILAVAILLPLWASYLVKVYAWKLILAKEGILTWATEMTHTGWLLNAALNLPGIGGNSLSTSFIGTFLTFTYVWLPFMILPMQAALERVPTSMLEASADLGATARQTFRTVVLPLAMPGIVAGSIFTFSLTLGDYIIPQIIGTSASFIGMAVYQLQGTAGNIPLAAAFAVVPIVIMLVYLALAKRAGAFDAL